MFGATQARGILAASLLAATGVAARAPAPPLLEHLPDKPVDRPLYNRHTGLFEPPFADLERAVERGDRADVARFAARIGPARLGEALRGGDKGRVVAALDSVTQLPGSVRLLDSVTPLVWSPDAVLAERAARALGQMLDGSEPRRLEDWDTPADAVARACRALNDVALRPGAAQAVRLTALDALADAGALCAPAPLSPLLADAAPAIRRAALMALRPRDEVPDTILRQAFADLDPGVVSGAAVVWCRHRVATRQTGTRSAAAASVLPLLRALAQAESTTLEDAVEILPCIAGSPDPVDRQALEQLRRSKNALLRARAAELGAAGASAR